MANKNNKLEDKITQHLIRLFADKFVNYLGGKGYLLSSENEAINKFWANWQINSHFEQLVHQIISETSINGEVAVGIEALIENDEQIFVVKDNIFAQTWRFNELYSITLLKTIVVSQNLNYYLLETWTNEYVDRRFFTNKPTPNNRGIPLAYSSIQLKLPLAYQNLHEGIKPNPYKFIPFEVFQNYYFFNKPDVNKAELEIENYTEYKNFEINEWGTGGTILAFNNLDQSTMKTLANKATNWIKTLKKVLFGQGTKGAESKTLEYVNPNYQINPFIDMDKYYLSKIYQAVGLQFDTKIENSTATEASLNHSSQGSTINLKRQTFNDAMNRLLFKLFNFRFDIEDMSEFEFTLNENTALNLKETTEQVRIELELGLISKKDAIIKINGCNEKEALNRLDKINDEKIEALKMINEHYPAANQNDANTPQNQTALTNQEDNNNGINQVPNKTNKPQ